MLELVSKSRPVTNFVVDRDAYLKRRAVRYQADELLEGRPTKIIYQGRQYTLDDAISATVEHDLFRRAALAAYIGNPNPLKDLMRRCAQFAICEHLFEGESESLGFMP